MPEASEQRILIVCSPQTGVPPRLTCVWLGVSVVLGGWLLPRVAGAAPEYPGVVAVSNAEGGEWQVVSPRETLGSVARLRSSATGLSRVNLSPATCTLLPESEAIVNRPDRRITLVKGEILLSIEDGDPWTIVTAGATIEIPAKSAAAVARESTQAAAIRTARGTAHHVHGADRSPLAEGHRHRLVDASITVVKALDEDDYRQLNQLADPAPPAQGLGQLLIQDAQRGGPRRLNVARYHANVVLQPPVALVQLDQSFYNPERTQAEGTFVFNLPPGASVSRFAMYVSRTQLIEGELIRRDLAAGIYQSIVNRQRDPAILEQIGDNLFRMRVFPVPGGDIKRILLDFTVPISEFGREGRFELPLLSDLHPVWDFKIGGVLRGTAWDRTVCPTHPEIEFKRGDAGVRFEFARHNYRPDRNCIFEFTRSVDAPSTVQAYQAEALPPRDKILDTTFQGDSRAKSAGYLLASIQPKPEAGPARPKDLVLALDTSAGMQEIERVESLAHTLLQGLRDGDRFRIVCVDVGARWLSTAWRTPNSPEATADLRLLSKQFCLGGTHLLDAFSQIAAELPEIPAEGRQPLLIYIGDGQNTQPNVGPGVLLTSIPEILQRRKTPLFIVQTPTDPESSSLLASISRSCMGELFNATSSDGMSDLAAWAWNGYRLPRRIVELSADGIAGEDLFAPSNWRPNEALRVIGRVAELPRSLRIKARLTDDSGTHEEAWELPLGPEKDDIFIGRLWAQRQLERLIKLREQAHVNARGSFTERIVAVSEEWSLMSPDTAFLVLETEQDYVRWKIDRRQRRRYWKPDEAVVDQSLPPDWLAEVQMQRQLEQRQAQPRRPLSKAEVAVAEDMLRAASAAIREQRWDEAQHLLARSRLARLNDASAQWETLQRVVSRQHARDALLTSLGARRSLMDPAAPWLPLGNSTPAPLVGQVFPRELLRIHPHAQELMREVDWPRRGTLRVRDVVDLLRLSGVNVVVAEQALTDEGVTLDERFEFMGSGRTTLLNCAEVLLGQMQLRLIDEPHRLYVTTAAEAVNRQTLQEYPVADILLSDREPDPSSLIDPIGDYYAEATQRLQKRLAEPISISLDAVPLSTALKSFSRVAGSMVVNCEALRDEGVSMDTPVDAHWRDVPAGEGLKWLLEPLQLRTITRNGTLVITTAAEAVNERSIRLYPVDGVGFELSGPALEAQQRRSKRWGMGMMGGGMSMGGMGMMGGSPRGFGSGLGAGASGMGGMGLGGMGAGMSTGVGSGVPVTNGNIGIALVGPSTSPGATSSAAPVSGMAVQPPPAPGVPFASSIVATVQDTTGGNASGNWQDVDGEGGSIDFLPFAAAMIVRQTDAVHEEIRDLLKSLRAHTAVAGQHSGVHPMVPRQVPAGRYFDSGFRSLIQAVQDVTGGEPDGPWQDVDGEGGQLQTDYERQLLLIRQTQAVHTEIQTFFTDLRRLKYSRTHRDTPWRLTSDRSDRPWVGSVDLTAVSSAERLSLLPPPHAGELELLRVRREPGEKPVAWRRLGIAAPDDVTRYRRSGERLQWMLPECEVRTQADDAALVHPSLTLIEAGPWGEGLRRVLDGRLPWMPHRTNAELAQLFDVRQESEDETSVTLRMVIPGGPDDHAAIRATFFRTTGEPLAWEAVFDDVCILRLQFERNQAGELTAVTVVDSQTESRGRWERVDPGELAPPFEDLLQGPNGFVRLDHRLQAEFGSPILQALKLMDRGEWQTAAQRLELSPQFAVRQPLVLFLWAWCAEQDRSIASRAEQLGVLRTIAASQASGLIRFISTRDFGLSTVDRYELSRLQPDSTRSAADLLRLAEFATDAGRLTNALEHLRAAEDAIPGDVTLFSRRVLEVKTLLRLDDFQKAAAVAREWARRPDITSDELGQLSRPFEQTRQIQVADELLRKALAGENLPASQRVELLRRLSEVQSDLTRRWDILLQALRTAPASSGLRVQVVDQMLCDLTRPEHAATAGELATRTDDTAARIRLTVRQAELTQNVGESARICWKLYEANELPQQNLDWAVDRLIRGGMASNAIELIENRLRRDLAVPQELRLLLAEAYEGEGRRKDALRAHAPDQR